MSSPPGWQASGQSAEAHSRSALQSQVRCHESSRARPDPNSGSPTRSRSAGGEPGLASDRPPGAPPRWQESARWVMAPSRGAGHLTRAERSPASCLSFGFAGSPGARCAPGSLQSPPRRKCGGPESHSQRVGRVPRPKGWQLLAGHESVRIALQNDQRTGAGSLELVGLAKEASRMERLDEVVSLLSFD